MRPLSRPPGSPAGGAPFQLPPGVTVSKQTLRDGWAYVFRHQSLGELGRILVQEGGDGNTHISCEVVGDPADPKTAERTALFEPLALALSERIATTSGTVPTGSTVSKPPPPPDEKELVESKLMQCERCGKFVAMLIFAPEATDPGRFADYARQMYPQYSHQNLPTWVIGPALGTGPLMDRPAEIQKVWPEQGDIEVLRPAEFNAIVDALATAHCAPR